MSGNTMVRLSIGAVLALLLVHAVTVQSARRQVAEDNRTSSAITVLSNAVESVYESDRELPQSIDEVVLDNEQLKAVADANLEYQVNDDSSYEICAIFNKASQEPDFGSLYNPLAFPDFDDFEFGENFSADPYEHDAGRECFEYNVLSGAGSSYDFGGGFDDFDFSQPPTDFNDLNFDDLEGVFDDPAVLEELNSQLQ